MSKTGETEAVVAEREQRNNQRIRALRREAIATHVLAGLLANPELATSLLTYDDAATEAVKHADALLAALEET